MSDSDAEDDTDYNSQWLIGSDESQTRPSIVATNDDVVYTYSTPDDSTGGTEQNTVQTRSVSSSEYADEISQEDHKSRSSTAGEATHTAQQQSGSSGAQAGGENRRGRRESVGEASDHWRRIASALVFALLSFFVGLLGFVTYTFTQSRMWLYLIGISSLLYLFLRFAITYYMYQDAKLLRYHTRQREKSMIGGVPTGWSPSPFMWGLMSFVMPPMAEFAPVVAFLYRRHSKTGVP